MKRPRLCWRLLIPIGVVGLPPVLWGLALAVVPTDCFRQKIVAVLSAATGRPVTLGAVRLGVCGGVRLADLTFGAPGSATDPWLKLGTARINVSVLQLLAGQVDPTEIDVDGLTLRVLRRKDGSLELEDMLRANTSPAPAPAATDTASASAEPTALEVRLSNATIHLIDEPSGTRLDFEKVEARATWHGRRATIQEMHGTLNGGPFNLVAALDRTGAVPTFEGQVHAQDVALSEGMGALSYLAPVLARTPGAVEGTLGLAAYLRGQGLTAAAVERSLVGQGTIALDPIQLDGSKLVAQLGSIVPLPAESRVGSVKSDFTIKDARVSTENLTINLAKVPIVLSGWTGFDETVDYRVRSDRLTEKIAGKARELLSDLALDATKVATIRVRGNLAAPSIALDGEGLESVLGGGDDRQKLRDVSRKLRDRLLR